MIAKPELNAFGREIRPLCFTRAQDELLALGYPHLLRLVDGHKDDKKAEANALKAAYDFRWIGHYRVDWPRDVAQRFVRLAGAEAFHDWTRGTEPTDAERALASRGGPVGEDEARAILAAAVPHGGCAHTWRVEKVDFLLEQMVGTEVVVDAILTVLERLPELRFLKETDGPDRQLEGHVLNVGFMLLRLTPPRREHHRARLAALWDAHHARSESWEVKNALDRVLNGVKAFQHAPAPGHEAYDYLEWHVHVMDDPAHVRAVIAAPETVYGALDVRFVYLAGPEVLATMGKHRPNADRVQAFLHDVGMIKHESTVDLFLEHVGKSSAKQIPLDWFRANEAFTRPILEKLAKKKGAGAERAATVLAGMRAPVPTREG